MELFRRRRGALKGKELEKEARRKWADWLNGEKDRKEAYHAANLGGR